MFHRWPIITRPAGVTLLLFIHVVGVLSLLASNVLLLVLILKTSLGSGAARKMDTPVCSRPGCPHNPNGPRLVA